MAGGSLADDCCAEELAALVEHGYSISWSARRSSVCGIVRPIAFAVARLMNSSYCVGDSTGRVAGLAPRRILSTYPAARRNCSLMRAEYDMSPPASVNSRSE